MQVLLKGVRVLNPEQNLDQKSDILIEDGIIKEIGSIETEKYQSAKVLELEDKICVPGLYDMHVHLREPGREDEETVVTGSNSAAAGGFTGVACMPNTNPTIDTAEVVRFIAEKSEKHLG